MKSMKSICAHCGHPVWSWRHNPTHPSVLGEPEAHEFVLPGTPTEIGTANSYVESITPTTAVTLVVIAGVLTVGGFILHGSIQ